MLPNRNKVDISSFSEQEKELFQKYGKVPPQKNLLANKLKERKYFDSGDYAMSKAGVSPPQSVGTAIPSPANIPHASPPSQSIPGAKASSPVGSPDDGSNVGVGMSPPKQSSFVGSPSKEPISQHRPHGQ